MSTFRSIIWKAPRCMGGSLGRLVHIWGMQPRHTSYYPIASKKEKESKKEKVEDRSFMQVSGYE